MVTAMVETWSLTRTIEVLVEENREDLCEVIIVTSEKRATAGCLSTIDEITETHGPLVRKHFQELPFLGGAIRDGFRLATGEYTIIMSADLETPPEMVKEMIARVRDSDLGIVTASRWLRAGDIGDYHPAKKVFNYIFQKLFSTLYGVGLTDMTYGYRIFRTEIVKAIEWKSLRHPIFFETLLKPLRLGYKVAEIPVTWKKRQEGETRMELAHFLGYFVVGLGVRFLPKKRFLVQGRD